MLGCVQMAELVITPDLGVIIPPDDLPHATLKERATAACKTIYELAANGLDPELMVPTEEDRQAAEDILTAYAQDEETTNKSVTSGRMASMRPAAILELDTLLGEFSHAVVKNAVQIRTYVTNKLLQESANPDPRVRIRALELLGKISDVGLFTERSEVTITHRSTEDLKQSLREKLAVIRSKALQNGAEDANIIQNNTISDKVLNSALVVDVDAELGVENAV
jgi:hypothetical protein